MRAYSLGALPHGGRGAACRRTLALRRGYKGTEERNGMERPAEQGEGPVREPPSPAQGGARVAPDT